MARLVPLITPTPGHVGIEAVETPTFDEYIQSAPLFNSYRLKESLTRKILRRLGSKKVSGEITDWVAHRRILATKEDVYNLESLLSGSPRLRESQIEHISTKDNHENPPPSGYGGLKVVVVVTTKGYDPCVREIQIVDREQYYRNEFEPGISSHDAHERRQRHVSRARRQVYEYYRGILEEIFGSDKLLVDIK